MVLTNWLKGGIALCALSLALPAAAAENTGALKGIVKDAAGKPVADVVANMGNTW